MNIRTVVNKSSITKQSGGSLNSSVICVVLNWNGWHDTIPCIESLQNSNYSGLSIVLVDNGSSNDSVSRIRSAHPDLKILETGINLGFAAGNNCGIKFALQRGAKYVWLLNNDTVVERQTLTALVNTAEADPEVGEVGSVLKYAHSPNRIQAWGGGSVNLWTGITRHFHKPVAQHELDYLTAASVLIPAAVLRRVGLLDEGYFMYWEDVDLSYRIRRAGWKLAVAPDAVLLHKESASTVRKSPAQDRYTSASGMRFLRKYAFLPWIPIFALVFGRALKRFIHLDWKRGRAVLAGLADGQSVHR